LIGRSWCCSFVDFANLKDTPRPTFFVSLPEIYRIKFTLTKWVYGYGTYDNFLTAYKYAYHKYRPTDALIDSTGTQKLWNEQVLLDRGIIAAGMNFSGDKKGMLVAAMRLVERQLIRWPYIQGIRGQLLTYKLAEDNKLPQDLVAVLMMAAYHLRMYQWEEYAEEQEPDVPVVATPAHDARQVVLAPSTA
jgi:hypothetical protein